MVGCEGMICRDHLPDDFLEELAQIGTEVAATAAPATSAASVSGTATTAARAAPEAPYPTSPVAAASPEAVPDTRPAGPEVHSLQDVALQAMAQMLRLHKGNVSAAAKALGVSRNTIYRKKDLLPPDLLN